MRSDIIKRAIDIVGSLVGLILLLPIFGIVAFLIKRADPGPVFYRGQRMGKDGHPFGILKFRTMYENPSSYQGLRVTGQGDARITPIGKWLRDTKLNELPQLWNVLVGEMSLVGPRPEDPEIVKTWPEEAKREILSVRPGITSPASVLYRDEEQMLTQGDVMETYLGVIVPTKLRLDQLYVRHRSLWGDFDVVFWTLLVVVFKSLKPGEERLFLGPIANLMRRYVSWFMIDLLITFFAIGVAGVIWRSVGPLDIGVPLALIIALGFAILFSMVSAILGMDKIAWSHANASDVLGVVFSAMLAMGFALILNEWIDSARLLPAEMVYFASALSCAGFIVARYRSRIFVKFGNSLMQGWGSARLVRERVLIIGGGLAGQFIAWLLNNSHKANLFEVVGYVDDDFYKQGVRFRGITVIGRRTDIPRLVEQHDIGIILFAIHNVSVEERTRLLDICYGTSARVVLIPDVMGRLDAAISAPQGASVTTQSNTCLVEGNAPGALVTRDQLNRSLGDLDIDLQLGDWDSARAKIKQIQINLQGIKEI